MEIPVFNANCVDPDQMPQNAAPDLGLHCLPMTLLGVSQLKQIKEPLIFVLFFLFLHKKKKKIEKGSCQFLAKECAQYRLTA